MAAPSLRGSDPPKSGEVLIKAGRRITRAIVKKIKDINLTEIEVQPQDLEGKVLAKPLIDESTGEIIADANNELTVSIIKKAVAAGIENFYLIFFDGLTVGPFLRNTLLVDKVNNKEESLVEIYKRLRPGEPPVLEAAEQYFNRLFFDPEAYDLSEVGRIKINHKFGISMEECPPGFRVLTHKDILSTFKMRKQCNVLDCLANVLSKMTHTQTRADTRIGNAPLTCWIIWEKTRAGGRLQK